MPALIVYILMPTQQGSVSGQTQFPAVTPTLTQTGVESAKQAIIITRLETHALNCRPQWDAFTQQQVSTSVTFVKMESFSTQLPELATTQQTSAK